MKIVYNYSHISDDSSLEQLPESVKSMLIHDNSCVKCSNFPKCPNPNKSKTHSCPQFSRRISPHAENNLSD